MLKVIPRMSKVSSEYLVPKLWNQCGSDDVAADHSYIPHPAPPPGISATVLWVAGPTAILFLLKNVV